MSVSKFDTLPFNCYELGHTWSPHCTPAALLIGYNGVRESLKIYASYYLISQVLSRRIPKNLKELRKYVEDVVRSSLFLAMNSFGYIIVFCWIRKFFGKFNFFTSGIIPALAGCYAAILIEKPSRRPLLALYVTNVASETVFRMLRSRGLVRDIKHFDLFLFVLSATTMLYQMKKGNRRQDLVDSLFTKIMGPEEFLNEQNQESTGSNSPSTEMKPRKQLQQKQTGGTTRRDGAKRRNPLQLLWIGAIQKKILQLTALIRRSHPKCDTCPHKDATCLEYSVKGLVTRFVSGFGIQAALQILLQIRTSFRSKTGLNGLNGAAVLKMFRASLSSGVGLGGMCLAYRALNCCFRLWPKSLPPATASIVSAVVSTFLGCYFLGPPVTLAVYIFFKAVERVISESHKSNNWKIIKWVDSVYGGGWSLLYAVSTAFLVHTAILEPQNLKPSYAKFLWGLSGGKLQEFNRHLLSVYGTESSLIMKDFWPTLDPTYLSENMKKLIRQREASGAGNKLIRELTLPFVS